MAPPRARKKSQGRRKIEMKLIEDENARTVTFSKRRVGLFRKATELSVMNPMANSQDSVQGMRIRAARLQELKEQCDQTNEEVEAKKRRGREIEAELEGSPYRITQETLDAMNYEQLKELQAKMEKLRDYVLLCANGPPQECHDGPPNLMNDNSPAAPSPVKGTGPATPSEVDLANVDWNEGDGSPIPYDWLKL